MIPRSGGYVLKENTIRDGGSTALSAAYTVNTVDTVDRVYTVDMVCTVYTVHTIETVLHCSNVSMYVYIVREG